jgi:hypothetical protein
MASIGFAHFSRDVETDLSLGGHEFFRNLVTRCPEDFDSYLLGMMHALTLVYRFSLEKSSAAGTPANPIKWPGQEYSRLLAANLMSFHRNADENQGGDRKGRIRQSSR